ncbi:MAG: HAD family hydrolase [Candidatus Thiodiazotropha sp.]
MSSGLRQIVLDFDGVIADDTNQAYIDTYIDAVRAVDDAYSPTEIEAGILRHWGESPRRELAGVLGASHPALDRALSHYQQHIDERLVAAARPLPGILAALHRLVKSYRLYLISGMAEAPLSRIVEGFGLKTLFSEVISTSDSDLPEHQKATGYHLCRLCQRHGLDVTETLCVGDAKSDVSMAHNCGIPIVVVLSGALDRSVAADLGVPWVIPSLAELPDFLNRQSWPPMD